MGEVVSYFKEKHLKKSWQPKYDELFSVLTVSDVDNSIIPFIELLKTSDYKKALATFKASEKNIFDTNKTIESSFKKFVEYLLEDNRYIDLFQQAMGRYPIKGGNKEVFEKVYNTTYDVLNNTLNDIIKGNVKEFSFFYISQLIKILRGEVFAFDLGNGVVWFEKDYLYGSDAEKINEDHSSKPVYGLRAHVGEGASIYSIRKTFAELSNFLKNVDVGVAPYVGMRSWLLDTDFVRYRCEKKGWDKDKIDNFIAEYYGVLGDITLKKIKDSKKQERISKRIKNHLKESDRELVKAYLKEGNQFKEGESLKKL